MTLRLGIAAMPTSAAGVELVRQAERLGVDSVWVPEFWAADALTPLAYLAGQTATIRLATGIVQLGARTPAMLAMSAMSLQALSGGRFVLGIGSSGPQVMEGWHGVRFDKPVRRTRETIDIIRAVTAGHRLEYDGEIYRLPLPGGEGRAIRSLMLHRTGAESLLPGVGVPTLVLSVRDDVMGWRPDEARRTCAAMPDCRVEEVAGTGHISPLLVDPDRVRSLLLEFWAAS